MPGSFWKITALVGVLGLGCLIVMQAQKGMSNGTTSEDDFEDIDAAFDELAGEDDPLADADADDAAQDVVAANEQADAEDETDDADSELLWEPTPVESVSTVDPFAEQPTDADDSTSAEEVSQQEADGADVQLASDESEASGDEDVELALNDSPFAPWAADTETSSIPATQSSQTTESGTSSTSDGTSSTTGRSPFLVLPPSSVDEASSDEEDETTETSSSAGPTLQSMPSHFTSPALLPTPIDDETAYDNLQRARDRRDVHLNPESSSYPPTGGRSWSNDLPFPPTVIPAADEPAESEDDDSDSEVASNPFEGSASAASSSPASSAPRTLSFPAAGGASGGNPFAASNPSDSGTSTSSELFAPTSENETGASTEADSSSSVPSETSSASNPFLPTDAPAATSDETDAPAPIRVEIPGRASLDDPAPADEAAVQDEPTPAVPSSNPPANPFPLTSNPRPIDADDSATTTPAPRISFPSVNPASDPATTNENTPSPFPSSLPSTSQTPGVDVDADTANPFAQSAEAPESTVPSPFPSTIPQTESTADPANISYAGDGTVEGIVSSSHQPQLQIEKVAPPEAIVGEFVIYEIHVSNVGQSAAHDVVIEDRIPLGSELKGTIPRAELVGTQLLWRLGTMEPGAEEIIKVRVIPTAAGEIGSVATVSFTAEVAATTVVTAPDLSVDVTGPEEMAMGEEGAYHFVIRNDGDGEARDVMIVAMLPEGLAHPGGQELEYAVGTIAPGDVRTADLVLTATSSGPATSVAQVTINGQVHDEATIGVNLLESRLEVRRQGPIRRFVGRPATYTNIVTNLSSQPLENVAVVEAIPHGLDLASIPEGGRFDPVQRTITWTVARLEPHQSLEFRSSIVAAQEGQWDGSLVASDNAGNLAQLATQIDVAGFSSLLVDVEHAGQPVLVGEQVSLRLTVRNAGTAAAHGVQAVVEVPAELEFVTAQGPVAHTIDGRTVTFETIEDLSISGEQSFDLVFTAASRGDARVRVSLIASDLENPIVQEQAVRIFDEN